MHVYHVENVIVPASFDHVENVHVEYVENVIVPIYRDTGSWYQAKHSLKAWVEVNYQA